MACLTQNMTKNGEVTVTPINNTVLSMLSSSPLIRTSHLVATGHNAPILSENVPYFDASSYCNMTAVTGDSATLKCRVCNLGNKTGRFHVFNNWRKVKKTRITKMDIKWQENCAITDVFPYNKSNINNVLIIKFSSVSCIRLSDFNLLTHILLI